MKTLLMSIFLITSSHCFAQESLRDSLMRDSLKTIVVAKALQDTQYKKVVADISLLKSHIKLANEGKLTKAGVLKEYNTTLSPGMGTKQSFEDVESRINSAGDSYVKYVLLMTQARIAKEEAEKKRKKS